MIIKSLLATIFILMLLFEGILYYQHHYMYCIQSPLQQKNMLLKAKAGGPLIILWDLHQVVFQRSILYWCYLFFKHVKPISIITHLDTATLKVLVAFILKKINLSQQEVASEELIQAARTANNHDLVQLVVTITTHYYPDEQVVDIIKTLHKRKYIQHIGSNIGPTVFGPFCKKFESIFTLFSHNEIVSRDPTTNLYIKKPQPLFFKQYLKKQKVPAANVIFIDDKKANVAAAQKEGMIGILFKNASQLRNDLSQLDIL